MQKFTKVNQWQNTAIYQASANGYTTNVEIDSVRDKKGTLKKVHTSILPFFEAYTMQEVKAKIFTKLNSL